MSRSRVVDVGIPPDNFNGWTTTEVRIHGFANIIDTQQRIDNSTISREMVMFMLLFGEWCLYC